LDLAFKEQARLIGLERPLEGRFKRKNFQGSFNQKREFGEIPPKGSGNLKELFQEEKGLGFNPEGWNPKSFQGPFGILPF